MKTNIFGMGMLAIVLTAGFAATGLAAPAPLGDDVPDARPLRKLVSGQFGRLLALRSELDVTAEQRTQIRAIVKSHKSELAAALQPVAEKRRALRAATLAEKADESSIRDAADELGKAIGNAAVVGAKIKSEIYQVLTPEQREKITEFRGESDSAVDRFLAEAAAAE